MIHFGTIRKYTAALLDLFNSVEIQYLDSNKNVISKNIPLRYSVKEKSTIFDSYTTEQLLTGNYNVLPVASLSLVSLMKSEERVLNKHIKINKVNYDETYDFMYNSVPYEFTYELTFQCRGMNEATMIVEQILPKFNPTYNIDVWDVQNLDEPTRIPVRLLDISIESSDYEEFSQNILTVTLSISVIGNIYPPIKSTKRIKGVQNAFNIFQNNPNDNVQSIQNDKLTGSSNITSNQSVTVNEIYSARKSILGWDPSSRSGIEITNVEMIISTSKPSIIDIVANNLIVGTNELTAIYEDKDNTIDELTFKWELTLGDGELIFTKNLATLTVTDPGYYTIEVTITDKYGNYSSLSKDFLI